MKKYNNFFIKHCPEPLITIEKNTKNELIISQSNKDKFDSLQKLRDYFLQANTGI